MMMSSFSSTSASSRIGIWMLTSVSLAANEARKDWLPAVKSAGRSTSAQELGMA
jgi:hypothetical protein